MSIFLFILSRSSKYCGELEKVSGSITTRLLILLSCQHPINTRIEFMHGRNLDYIHRGCDRTSNFCKQDGLNFSFLEHAYGFVGVY